MNNNTNIHDINPGDFIVYTMVTDTAAYYVTKVTDKSIWIVPACSSDITQSVSNGSPFPIVYTALEAPADLSDAKRIGLRKDGTFRIAEWAHAFHKAPVINFDGIGERPFRKTDYSF